MARTVGIGHQDFERIIQSNLFYIDKTAFIREWWESRDEVTLITRPRRFGKTLNMSMLEKFFSVRYAGRSDLFEGLSIWQEEAYRDLQGTWPVISLSFANVKENTCREMKQRICQLVTEQYNRNCFLAESGVLTQEEKNYFQSVSMDMPDVVATLSLYRLTDFLSRYYGKKVIILLDEYDTPMQEAWVGGFWEEAVAFLRALFNATFKTNPWLQSAVMTGITRISKESVFSDLNNLEVVTTTSDKYGDAFGFTQEEVAAALDEYGLMAMEKVKSWYDGFVFGKCRDIYNPWSILNFLDKGKLGIYWANTSSNSLVGKLIREGDPQVKVIMEDLLCGKTFHTVIDEQIIFHQLNRKSSALWSLLLASGYLRVENVAFDEDTGKTEYGLKLTNREVRLMFGEMIDDWFLEYTPAYNAFLGALLQDDRKAMNIYMNRVALATFSFFDVGKKPSRDAEPERFYHGFVLGLLVDLADRYAVTSNRESGFGRYDVMLEPRDHHNDGIIIEFKVHEGEEKSLEDTAQAALNQIRERKYASALADRGVKKIRCYGFAFEGKQVLIRGTCQQDSF